MRKMSKASKGLVLLAFSVLAVNVAAIILHTIEKGKYQRLFDKVLGLNSYADTNKDGRVSIKEYARAAEVLFEEEGVYVRDNHFPIPTRTQLENAVALYEAELNTEGDIN